MIIAKQDHDVRPRAAASASPLHLTLLPASTLPASCFTSAQVATAVCLSCSITKVLPGRYLLLGTQGPKRSGLVQAPPGLPEGNPGEA